MKTIIIYHSECGHTKRYAEFLNTRILADKLIHIKDMKLKELFEYDSIFYGGNIKNNEIVGLDKLLKHYDKLRDKNIFIFGVGMSSVTGGDYARDLIITANNLDNKHVRLYLLPGGIDLNLMSPIKRKMFLTGLKLSEKKIEDPQQKMALDMLKNKGIDLVDINKLDPIVSRYNKVKDSYGKKEQYKNNF